MRHRRDISRTFEFSRGFEPFDRSWLTGSSVGPPVLDGGLSWASRFGLSILASGEKRNGSRPCVIYSTSRLRWRPTVRLSGRVDSRLHMCHADVQRTQRQTDRVDPASSPSLRCAETLCTGCVFHSVVTAAGYIF
jgi:hypothetical protein